MGTLPAAGIERLAERASAGAWTGAALMLLTGVFYSPLGLLQSYHWTISNGFMFGWLWWLPRRRWPWVFAGIIATRVCNRALSYHWSGLRGGPFLGYWNDIWQFLLGIVSEPFLVATGVCLLQAWRMRAGNATSLTALARLHVAALLSALAVSAKDLAYVCHGGYVADVRLAIVSNPVPIGDASAGPLLAFFSLSHVLGNFVGIMLLAPFALWLGSGDQRTGTARIAAAALQGLLPVLFVFMLVGRLQSGSQLADVLKLLLMAAVMVFALRHGWRGAAVAVLAASVAIVVEEYLGQPTIGPVWWQAFLAITGAMALLMGAAVDDLRGQARQLQRAHDEERRLLGRLREAALNIMRVEDQERRRLAGELHDEFGQNLAALQTQIKLAEPDFDAIGRRGIVNRLMDMTRAMRGNIAGVLEALRPPALDELGLYGALDRGALRHLAENAGLHYELLLEGDARLLSALDDTHRVAAYRLVQEAVTNVVRHARASRCRVRLRCNRRHGVLWLFLDVQDDGIGLTGGLRSGNGLRSMRDRITALDGRLHFGGPPGMRVHALVRQG